MVSASGRPEEDTSLVPGWGCSGVFGGACGLLVCVRALGWSDTVVGPPLCWVLGLGARRGFRLAGLGFPLGADLTSEAVVDMII